MRKYYFVLLLFFLTACGAPPETYPQGTPTETPNPGEIALNMIQQQMAAEATSQIVGLQFTATAEVLGITATSQFVGTQEAITQQARHDAQATSDQGRRDAAATQARLDAISTAERQQVLADAATEQARKDAQYATEQAMVAILNTQSADATSTFTAMTLTAIPPHATLTQMAVNNQIVMSTQEVERAELQLKQARDTNVIQWLIPTILAICAAVAGGLYLYNHSQVREVQDADGNVDVIIYKNRLATKPAQWTGSVLDLRTVTMPLLSAPKEQADVTRRAQAIQALAVMPVQPTASSAAAFNDAFSIPRNREESFEIIDGDELPPAELLSGETLKVLHQDWKDANEK